MMTTAKLSQHQRVILMSVYSLDQKLRPRYTDPSMPAVIRAELDVWGVEWWPSTWWPNVKPASVSRSLRELEARGLLLRQNQHSGSPGQGYARTRADEPAPRRCTHVLLTEQGREAAKLLISHVTQDINSLQEG